MKKNIFILVTLSVLGLFGCYNHKNVDNELNNRVMITKDFTFKPEGVCSQQFDISVVNDTIRRIIITKGCPGNTQAVSRLVEGMQIDDAISKLNGILCGEKSTSCPDQLATALKIMKQ
jgi:uncharacterized protein (TIGR03905 family)